MDRPGLHHAPRSAARDGAARRGARGLLAHPGGEAGQRHPEGPPRPRLAPRQGDGEARQRGGAGARDDQEDGGGGAERDHQCVAEDGGGEEEDHPCHLLT